MRAAIHDIVRRSAGPEGRGGGRLAGHDRLSSTDASSPADLWSGRYALEQRLVAVADVPFLGDERSVTRTWLLVDAERDGDRWIQRQRVCEVRIEGGRARMDVPAPFVDALPVRTYAADFPVPGVTLSYHADPGVQHLGYDPAVTDGVPPRRAGAPGVLDADGDGEPGATVLGRFPVFGTVRIYVAQRTHVVMRGLAASPSRITGGLKVRALEQRTLGASVGLFARTLEIRPDEAASGFTLVRAPEVRDCADLSERGEELFG